MTYEVSKEVMNEVIKEFAKTAKKLKGDLVVHQDLKMNM